MIYYALGYEPEKEERLTTIFGGNNSACLYYVSNSNRVINKEDRKQG